MKIQRTGPQALDVELDDEAELRREERTNLAAGGLFLRPAPALAPFTPVEVTLRLPGRGTTTVGATVVGAPPGALALQLAGGASISIAIVAALLATPPALAVPDVAPEPSGEASEPEGTLWDRLRAMTPPQKALLAPKADRVTRALLIQESDPMLLFSLLKNPRLTIDEVVRIAKSAYINFQAAEAILKTSAWAANLDVKLALIHNAKLPLPLALRILPLLPEPEVRLIAKGTATSMQLKQAALRRVTGG